MTRISKLALFSLVIGALTGGSSAARAQGTDPNLVKRGRDLWFTRSCDACHSIGKGRRAGPDLMGVTERRSGAWLRKWLKNTEEMQASDSTAMGLMAEFKGVKMWNPKLTSPDIEALISYIAAESRKKQ